MLKLPFGNCLSGRELLLQSPFRTEFSMRSLSRRYRWSLRRHRRFLRSYCRSLRRCHWSLWRCRRSLRCCCRSLQHCHRSLWHWRRSLRRCHDPCGVVTIPAALSRSLRWPAAARSVMPIVARFTKYCKMLNIVKHCETLVKHCDAWWNVIKHHEPLVKHHETFLKHCETSWNTVKTLWNITKQSAFDVTILALNAETSALGVAISAFAGSYRPLPGWYNSADV